MHVLWSNSRNTLTVLQFSFFNNHSKTSLTSHIQVLKVHDVRIRSSDNFSCERDFICVGIKNGCVELSGTSKMYASYSFVDAFFKFVQALVTSQRGSFLSLVSKSNYNQG